MAKSVVVKMCCDRCSATWYKDYVKDKPLPEAASLTLVLTAATNSGEKAVVRDVKYEELCDRCSQTVSNYIDGIDKSKAEKELEAKKEEEVPKDPTPPPAAPAGKTTGRSAASGRGPRVSS